MSKLITCKELIEESIRLFKKANIESPRLNAELIMAHCMNKKRIDLYIDYKKKMTKIEANYFRSLIQRRLKKEPVQYIVGHTEFMSLPFYINKFVLIPRPETEILVEKVLNFVLENKKKNFRILDMGTGSGIIIVSLAHYANGCIYYASDISKAALKVAKKNMKLNKIKGEIFFINADKLNCYKGKKFDCIVSNPPYISSGDMNNLDEGITGYEPTIALDGGKNGLDYIFYLIDNAHKYLKKNGLLALEFGINQSRKIKNHALKAGKYKNIVIIKDYSGKNRIILMKRK